MGLIFTGLTAPVALAAVALIGYVVGRARRRPSLDLEEVNRKLSQAHNLIEQVERISNQIRQCMAVHHSTVRRCRERIRVLSESHAPDTESSHHMNLQSMLAPTEELARDMVLAYDELRQHSRVLASLREENGKRGASIVHTDHPTGPLATKISRATAKRRR
jgi:hypothetical protein